MYQLSRLLHDYHRDLYIHLEQQEIGPSLYATPWFLTAFASHFPLGFVARVFGKLGKLLCVWTHKSHMSVINYLSLSSEIYSEHFKFDPGKKEQWDRGGKMVTQEKFDGINEQS